MHDYYVWNIYILLVFQGGVTDVDPSLTAFVLTSLLECDCKQNVSTSFIYGPHFFSLLQRLVHTSMQIIMKCLLLF